MKLSANNIVHIFLLCFTDVLIANINLRAISVAASTGSTVIASVGSRKELSCTTQTLNPTQQVSWYRVTNDDAKSCPNIIVFDGGSSAFCDRLTINRIVQPGFLQRFSVPPFKTENENGLIITKVELSDAGTYACVSQNDSKILSRINLTVEDSTTTTPSINDISPTSATYSALETSTQDIDTLAFETGSPSLSSEVPIFVCVAAIVVILVAIVIIVFLKIRRLKREKVAVGSFEDVVSGNGHIPSNQISNNMPELYGPVYDEIKEIEVVRRSADENQSIELSPVYDLLKATDDDESGLKSVAAAADDGEMKRDPKVNSIDSIQHQTNQNEQAISIYGVVNSDITENETGVEETTFNLSTMTAFNPVYGEIMDNNDITAENAAYCQIDDIKKTTADEQFRSNNSKTLQPKAPSVGLDGTVYLELSKSTASGVRPSVQQQPNQQFEKSVYATIDHNEKAPPPPPPSVPPRSSCAPPR